MLRKKRHCDRELVIALVAAQAIDEETEMTRLDTIRRLHRVSYHIWRIVHHQQAAETGLTEPQDDTEPATEAEDG